MQALRGVEPTRTNGPKSFMCGVVVCLAVISQVIFAVALAAGFHLFPYRTEQLSPRAPMVLTHQLGE